MKRAVTLVPDVALVAFAQQAEPDLQSEFDELSAKSSALIDTVNAMERHAGENGEALNPDLAERRDLLQTSISRAEQAFRDKDMKSFRTHLKRARGHLERLSKML